MTQHTPPEQELWDRWLRDGDRQAAGSLVEHYMYLVSYHVERIAVHLPKNVQKEELKSLGMVGLYDAIRKFEIERELKFDTYASFRVRGAIIDGLRKEDWLPRSIREKAKQIERVSAELEQRYHRRPTSQEIADQSGMSSQEVETYTKDILFAHVLSIEEIPNDDSDQSNEGIGYVIPDESADMPEDQVQEKEMKIQLAEAIKQLNRNEQLVLSLFYHEELTLTEIGKVMGLTTSRISQIHKKCIFKLKHILQKSYDAVLK
ncbi:RNA polymerase sigma-D factor [Lentibacillus sp. JNUCC-1]|uniref:FliA/WhiG family RNA polymerase sigma factor n=1 Tax=Lentibacillus sp. JNUCC-1 TaxID=2654513 RepID=UPI0012E91FC0|nr:FliA/WhiG family RNA polymerase sigma factor [Lentibacillus sp. JNUCC-1]MUV39936.1 RNA polymerase sigma-D factor [Lentibacillus sp. JNUCC-1]